MPPKAKAKAPSAPSAASSSASASSAAPVTAAKAPDTSQTLPSKEQTLFKQILRSYETKQYKKALKAAESILKKYSSHGETLAMKGLIYSQQKRVEEAHALVKRGLAANLNSHVCWHVSGLLYRAEQNYDQAIKCFQEGTEVLAFDGHRHRWMALDDLAQLTTTTTTTTNTTKHSPAPSPPLLIASYNASTCALEYQPMAGPLLIKHGHHRMINLRQQPQRGAGVVLRVTDDHTLYVRVDWMPPSHRQPLPLSDVAASTSTSSRFYRTQAKDLLVHSDDEELHVTVLASARNGCAGGESRSGGDDGGGAPSLAPQRPPFVAALGLQTEDEEMAVCEYLGAWLAMGSVTNADQQLRIEVGDAEAEEWMGAVLARLLRVIQMGPGGWVKVEREERGDGVEGEETACGGCRGGGRCCFLVSDPRWRRLIDEHCDLSVDGTAQRLPWWVLQRCSPAHLRALLKGYWRADGGSEAQRSVLFTSSVTLRDELVILCLHAGYTASFDQAEPAESKLHHQRQQQGHEQVALTAPQLWAVWFSDSPSESHPTLSSARDIVEQAYSGRVWCLTVPPHHLVLTRTILSQGADGEVLAASLPVFAGQCYQQALKKDPNNLQILKDLSALQVQRRSFEGFTETRRKILLLKTNNRNNWLAYAIGNQLSGDLDKAINVLDSFLHTQDDDAAAKDKAKQSSSAKAALTPSSGEAQGSEGGGEDAKASVQEAAQRELDAFESRSRVGLSFEDSELRLYRLSLLTERQQWQAALDYLDSVSSSLCDSLFALEQKADLLTRLGRLLEAEVYYRGLLAINPDAASYHSGLQAALVLSTSREEDVPALLSLYRSLQTTYPKSSLVRRIPLDFTSGDTFLSLLSPYMKTYIRKAIPSLFVDLRPLYRDPLKAAAIEQLVQQFLHNLRLHSTFDTPSDEQEGQRESPACLLWTLHYAAQHFDHTGRPSEALSLLSEAVRHTPTCVDVYMVQARVYKHAGDAMSAFQAMDACRRMDTADRYLNTKTVRYALRAGKAEVAEELVALFLRDDADGLAALNELQVMWWEYHRGRHFERVGEYGRALKDYLYIHKHFSDIYEDQFDFHAYCLRKLTLRAYLALLRWEDGIRGHKFFVRACIGLIRVYLHLWDAAREKERRERSEREDAALSEEERKAAIKRQKKAAAKEKKKLAAAEEDKKAADEAARKAAAVAGSAAAKNGKAQGATAPPDPDPFGESTLSREPLAEASRFLHFLQLHSSTALPTHLWAMEVQLRKAKWLLAWKAIKQARQLQADNAELHFGLMRWLEGIQQARDHLQPLVREVLEEEWTEAGHTGSMMDVDIALLNDQHLRSHLHNLDHRFAVARSLLLSSVGAERATALRLLRLQVDVGDSAGEEAQRQTESRSAASAEDLSPSTSPPLPRLSATFPSLLPLRPFPLSLALQVFDWVTNVDQAAAGEWALAMRAVLPYATAFTAATDSTEPSTAASRSHHSPAPLDSQLQTSKKQDEEQQEEDDGESSVGAGYTAAANGTSHPH